MSRGRLVIMGSGETAPTMVELHRSMLSSAGAGRAIMLDTSYGFQENADQLTRKTLSYFADSVGSTVRPLCWRTRLDGVELDRALTAVRGADWLFAGVGSPSYTSRVWAGSGFTDAVREMVDSGGCATFSSAAAITLGKVTLPVHEIYRCGAEPYWLPGLNLVYELTGLSLAVVPHFNHSAKNGTHDTRFCYLGERRIRTLESLLPAGTGLIGVDEHTALDLDLAGGTARVCGKGAVTLRVRGAETVLPNGAAVPIAELAPAESGAQEVAKVSPLPGPPARSSPTVPVLAKADRACTEFRAALDRRDADAAGAAALELEESMAGRPPGAAADEHERARRALRGMVLELAGAAENGLADRRPIFEPLVGALLEQRARARDRRDFATADVLRDRMAEAGVLVRDTPAGAEWSLPGG